MTLKIINILVYFAFFASIMLVAGSPSIFFDKTYVTPAPLAFFIGLVNHYLLLGSIIYQFFDSGKLSSMDRISWRFPLLVVLHAIYMNLLLVRHYILAFIFALLVDTATTNISNVVRSHVPGSWGDKFFIHYAFSLLRGWTSVLLIITALEAFGVNAQTDHAGIWTKVFAFLALYLLDRAAVTATQEMDFAASYAIRAGLSSIAYNQTSNLFITCVASFFAAKASNDYDYSTRFDQRYLGFNHRGYRGLGDSSDEE